MVDKALAIPIGILLIAIFSVQFGASLAKQVFPVVGAGGATVFRLVFAALIMCGISRPWKTKLTPHQLRLIVPYGVALGVMNLAFYLALERMPLGITVGIEFIGPLSVSLFASRKPLDFVWVMLAVCGIVMILPLSENSAPLDLLGVVYALIAAFCWAMYIVFGKKVGAVVQGGVASSLGMLIAAVTVTPLGALQAGEKLLNLAILPMALGMAVFSSALPFSLEMISLRSLSTQTFGILMSLEPAVGALLGLFFLNERLTLAQCFAIGCIVMASLGSSLSLGSNTAGSEPSSSC